MSEWGRTFEAIKTVLEADPVIVSIFGDAIRLAGTAEHAVPALDVHVITDVFTEVNDDIIVQFDPWCLTDEDLVAAEQALLNLFDDVPYRDSGGVYMGMSYEGGANLISDAMPEAIGPTRANYFGRALRFRLSVLRSAYVT